MADSLGRRREGAPSRQRSFWAVVTEHIAALARVAQLVAAARRIADRNDVLGREARERLPEATGLSPHNVDLGLRCCLEVRPTDDEVRALCSSVMPAPAAHVLLSANIFVASHRAIALALASSAAVSVRPSRRESVMTELLDRAAPGLFSIVESLAPSPGDHVWAYGRDETLAELRQTLPTGTVLHAHGGGFGVAVVEQERRKPPEKLAEQLALDILLFDQRGCLSPRALLFDGSRRAFEQFGRLLAAALDDAESACPRGWQDKAEFADARRVADTTLMTGSLIPAGKGWVGLVTNENEAEAEAAADAEAEAEPNVRAMLPPPGRHIVMARTGRPVTWLGSHSRSITAVGISAPDSTRSAIRQALPCARISSLGSMQSPPFDGPVDGRTPPKGEMIGR